MKHIDYGHLAIQVFSPVFSNQYYIYTVKILNFISLKSTVVKLTWLFNHVSICFQILGYYKQYVLWNFLNYVTNKAVIQGFERVFFRLS